MRQRRQETTRWGITHISQLLRARGYVALLIASLLVICLLSVLIPQEGSPAHPVWMAAHPWLAPVVEWTGFQRMFVSPPFIALLGMVTLSASLSLASRLNQLRIYAQKKGWSRLLVSRRRVIGSLVFHAGLVGLVGAAATSALTHSEGNIILTEGQTLDIDEHVLQVTKKSPLEIQSGTPFQVRLDKFHPVHDGRWGTPDYSSELTVLTDGLEVHQASVSVNHPLIHDGVTLHQSVHGFAPLFELRDSQGRQWFNSFVTLNSDTEAVPIRYRDEFVIPEVGLLVETEFFPDAHMAGEVLGNQSPNPNNPAMLVTVSNSSETLYRGPVYMGEPVDLGIGLQFGFSSVRYWAGFDAVHDSGVTMIFGFAWIALAGLVMRFAPKWKHARFEGYIGAVQRALQNLPDANIATPTIRDTTRDHSR